MCIMTTHIPNIDKFQSKNSSIPYRNIEKSHVYFQDTLIDSPAFILRCIFQFCNV